MKRVLLVMAVLVAVFAVSSTAQAYPWGYSYYGGYPGYTAYYGGAYCGPSYGYYAPPAVSYYTPGYVTYGYRYPAYGYGYYGPGFSFRFGY